LVTISAKIIAHSRATTTDVELVTFELEYPRFIHAEFMTHRMLSKNAASSRAIPVKRAIELIRADTAAPSHWGKNQPGMSAKEECNEPLHIGEYEAPGGPMPYVFTREQAWVAAREDAIYIAEAFDKAGYHKQIVNRLLEPFTHIKVVASGTRTFLNNLFWLRCHPDAQPEFQLLAKAMWEALEASTPKPLGNGDWHVPYFEDGAWTPGMEVPLEDAIAISSSCCAQVSYRRLDDSLEKARDIYKRLVETKPVHASPFEHQATPMRKYWLPFLDDGVTSYHRDIGYMSGNFNGWIQNRQLIEGNVNNEPFHL
jgi:thymidylate synthase ThyX